MGAIWIQRLRRREYWRWCEGASINGGFRDAERGRVVRVVVSGVGVVSSYGWMRGARTDDMLSDH